MKDLDEPGRALDVAREAQLTDAEERLERVTRRARRHLLWALLGVSPVALIPLLGLLAESSWDLIGVLILLVVTMEVLRYARARDEIRMIENEIAELRATLFEPER